MSELNKRDFTLDAVPGDVPDGMELADKDMWTCRDCGHIHAAIDADSHDRVRGNAEFASAGPTHDDICDCDTPLPMVCVYCGTDRPDDQCERGRCDDPRVP